MVGRSYSFGGQGSDSSLIFFCIRVSTQVDQQGQPLHYSIPAACLWSPFLPEYIKTLNRVGGSADRANVALNNDEYVVDLVARERVMSTIIPRDHHTAVPRIFRIGLYPTPCHTGDTVSGVTVV